MKWLRPSWLPFALFVAIGCHGGNALGLADARDLVKRGLVTKDGGPAAMDHYFHQISHPEPASVPTEGGTTIKRDESR